MKYSKFRIRNFKGIKDLTVNLDKSPDSNIYTLVGLNESGKTTILEAMNLFNPSDIGIGALELPGTNIKDYDKIIPVSERANFTDSIYIDVTLKLEADDIKKINQHTKENTLFQKIKEKDELNYFQEYRYVDSIYQTFDSMWSGFSGWLKTSETESYVHLDDEKYSEDNLTLATFCRNLIPSILYFPNFLFDIPSKIYLHRSEELTNKEKFYIDNIQDILNSLENNTNIETHIIDRVLNGNENNIKNLERLLQLMGDKVSEVIFEAWNKIFKRNITDSKVVIKCRLDAERLAYIEISIQSPDGIYQINDRSLGFRWFFIFLLFTQFRPYRNNTPKNIIYLFDEPASNLHSSAQKQLLESFENLIDDCKIIYTTHSHHLINPNWLESTYVVRNEGLNLNSPEEYIAKKTDISIKPYRQFVLNHPHNTAYFQPILDVLDYTPSNLESLTDCVLFEGKNDFYTMAYFQEIILSKPNLLNMSPSTGSGNLDTLISLYIGWGKEFVILLDSDGAGEKEKKRYIEKFGMIVESRVFTFEDIDSTWNNTEIEYLFDSNDALTFQKVSYPESDKFHKKHFNRAIQESLINKRDFNFSDVTIDNIEKIWDFLREKL